MCRFKVRWFRSRIGDGIVDITGEEGSTMRSRGRWLQAMALLAVGLVPVVSVAMTWDFDVEGDVQAWSADVATLSGGTLGGGPSREHLRVEDGILKVQTFKGAHQRPSIALCSPKIRRDAGLFDRVRFRMKVIYDRPVLGNLVFTWVTSEGSEATDPGRFVTGITAQVYSNEWEEIQISGFAENESKVWEGELIEFRIELVLAPAGLPVVTEGPDEVWVDWITITGPGEQAIGELEPPVIPDLSGRLFGSYVFYPVGAKLVRIVSGDLDGDGDLDLAVARQETNNALALLFNEGGGQFVESASYAVGGENRANMPVMCGADFNQDGAMDLGIYMTSTRTYNLWWNDGDGRFGRREKLDKPYWPLDKGDFDGDGDVDLLVIPMDRSGYCLGVLHYIGEETFVEGLMEERVGYGPTQVGDFDGDGDIDVLWRPLEGPEGGYLVTWNEGEGHLSEGERLAVTVSPVDIRGVRDLEGDGDVDLLVQLSAGGFMSGPKGLAILRNRGDGEIVEEVLYTTGELALAGSGLASDPFWVGDLNEDGEVDVVVPSVGDATVIVLLGQPDGTLKEDGRYPVSGSPQDIVAADLDGDGDLDLAVADRGGGVSILLNQIRQPVTDVEMDDRARTPSTCRLGKSYPNPFNAWTVIPFELALSGSVHLVVYDVLGRKLRTLLDGDKGKGSWVVRWDGRDDEGQEVSSGVYVVRMEAGTFTDSKTMTLVK